MNNKIKKLFSGAMVLALCSAAAKLLGAFFRIPLTNIIGAEGIGLYQMVFPLYVVLLTVSSGGISTAITKVISCARVSHSTKDTIKILKLMLVPILILSVVCALIPILFCRQIASVQGNSLAALAYFGIAPSIVFVAIAAALKGFFQGHANMLPSGISQIIEQLIKLVFGLLFASKLMKHGVAYAVLGATLAITLSEAISTIMLALSFVLFYRRQKRKTIVFLDQINDPKLSLKIPVSNAISPKSGVLKSVYAIAIPVTLGALIMPFTQLIDSVMVINILTHYGMDKVTATSLFGLAGGPIGSLINMPSAITLAFAVALLPKIAFLKEKEKREEEIAQEANQRTIRFLENNIEASKEFFDADNTSIPTDSNASTVKEKQQNNNTKKNAATAVSKSFLMIFLVCFPCAAIFMAFPHQIITTLYSKGFTDYQSQIASKLLRIESLSIIYIGIIQICTAVLQGASKPHRPAINMLYGAIVKVLLTLILLPRLGIVGSAIASVLCYGVVAVIDIIYLKKIIRPNMKIIKTILMPAIGCVLLVAGTFALITILNNYLPRLYAFVVSLSIGMILYALFLIITKTIRISELFA